MQQIFKSGETISTNFFLLYYYNSNKHSQPPRFGVVVGRKASKKAAQRNYCKRVMREAIQELIPKIEKGTLFVCVIRRGFDKSRLTEVKKEIQSVINKELLTQ